MTRYNLVIYMPGRGRLDVVVHPSSRKSCLWTKEMVLLVSDISSKNKNITDIADSALVY
jgi:hypothetical protein